MSTTETPSPAGPQTLVSVLLEPSPRRRTIAARTWAALAAAWGVVLGLLPHVLHHVGPLAGAALLAGAGGTALFAAIGFVASIPFLVRLHRRFHTWVAPTIATALFAAMFAFSSLVIAPMVTGGTSDSSPPAGVQQTGGSHAGHHAK